MNSKVELPKSNKTITSKAIKTVKSVNIPIVEKASAKGWISHFVKHNERNKNDERQDWINYAYKIWWKDFLLTILAENSTMWIDRKSNMVWANWYSDYWLCQINVWRHPEVLWWSNWKRFKDWFYDPYKQLDYCNNLFTNWTRFYWYDVRHKMESKITFK